MRTTEDLIFLSNSCFLPFRSGRKWPGIYSSHNGQWKGRLHWERSANPGRWRWRYTIWDSQTEAKDGYYGRDILWQMAHRSYQTEFSADALALSSYLLDFVFAWGDRSKMESFVCLERPSDYIFVHHYTTPAFRFPVHTITLSCSWRKTGKECLCHQTDAFSNNRR